MKIEAMHRVNSSEAIVKLRQLTLDKPTADFILMNGNRVQIKRKLFEQFIDSRGQ